MSTKAEQSARRRATWLPEGTAANATIAAVVIASFLLTSLASSGIWDPHELRRAELARRIAIHLFGASELVVDRGSDAMPTLSDLGAGELPFTSMAAGLSVFGLVDWAGRLPLALWGAAGALVLFAFFARYVRPRAGLYAVIALVTMPLYFMQARTMLGDVVTMAAFAMAFFGGLGAMVESRSTPVTVAWGLLAAFGLVAGFLCRGVLLGVAVPSLGVGASWWVARLGAGERSRPDVVGVVIASGMLIIGGAATTLGIVALQASGWSSELVPRVVGFTILSEPPVSATFDLNLRDLGHALFPWSAMLPFAFGRLSGWDRQGGERDDLGRLLRVGLVVGTAVAFVVHAGIAPHAGSLPFVATTLLAAVIGLVVSDFDSGAPHGSLVGFGTTVLGLVLLWDLRRMPNKLLTVFHLPPGAGGGEMEVVIGRGLTAASLGFLLACWLTWRDPARLLSTPAEDSPSSETAGAALRRWMRRRIADYERAVGRMAALSGGNVAFALLVVEAGLVGVGIMLVVGRHLGWQSVATMSRPLARVALNAWWAVPLGLLVGIVVVDLARGLFAFALAWMRVPRASAIALAALLCGGVVCFGDYAALAEHLSPKGAFVEYASRRRGGEPLALLGVDETTGRYYAGGAKVLSLSGPREAVRWLTAGRRSAPPERRWLVLQTERLAPINALFREREGMNVPVLGDTKGKTVLAVSELDGAANDNPLEPFVLPSPPSSIQHPAEANLGGRVRALGWELRDERGELARVAIPGRRYRLTVWYRVVARLRHDYQAFLHVDGEGRRHNADHEPVGGLYPSRWWRSGDVIADVHELVLEPNFTPGRYAVYFGLFIGKQRLEVRHGRHRDDRVVGGTLVVL